MAHKPETLALHAGYRSDDRTNAVAVPIYQTTSTSSTAPNTQKTSSNYRSWATFIRE